MKERLKTLRKHFKLTQQEFSDKLGIKRTNIACYETGKNTPSDAVISLICREFKVDENWLRTGEGDMFLTDRKAEINKLTQQLLGEESDSFKNRFINMLSNLNVDEWKFLEKKARELVEIPMITEENTGQLSFDLNNNVDSSSKTSSFPHKNLSKLSIDEKVALYRQELEREEKKQRKGSKHIEKKA